MKQLLEFGTHCPQTHALSYESYCGCCCSFGGGLGVGHLKITAPNRFLVFRILRKYSFLSLELNHKKAESPDFSFLENFCQIFLLFKTRLALLFVLVTWQPWLYLIPCNHSPVTLFTTTFFLRKEYRFPNHYWTSYRCWFKEKPFELLIGFEFMNPEMNLWFLNHLS